LFNKYSNVPVSRLPPVTPVIKANEYTDKKSFGSETYLLFAVDWCVLVFAQAMGIELC
jgi:hypothetical protein